MRRKTARKPAPQKGTVLADAKASVIYFPNALYQELEQRAAARGKDVNDFLRRCIKLGMVADSLSKQPEGAVIFRDVDGERELDFWADKENPDEQT